MKRNIERLHELRKYKQELFKHKIIKIIMDLGSASPSEIKEQLDLLAEKELEEYIIKLDYPDAIKDKEKEKRLKQNTRSREDIQRKLKIWCGEGLFTKSKYSKYSLSNLAEKEIKRFDPLFGQDFGVRLLSDLQNIHYSNLVDFKTNIQQLVNIFGFYMVFCLVEACRPMNIEHESEYIENKTKDYIAVKWFEHTLHSTTLLNSFLSSVSNQTMIDQSTKSRKTMRKKHRNDSYIKNTRVTKQGKKGYPNPRDSIVEKLNENMYTDWNPKYHEDSNPSYELDQELVIKIKDALKELFPQYFDKTVYAMMDFMGRPKEGSNKDRRDKFLSFNPDTGETEIDLD